MKRRLLSLVAALVALACLVYAGDYLVLRIRVATGHSPFGSVTVRSYYAIPEKNNRTEYVFNDARDQTCVHSIFAQLGYVPCWYLARHADKPIEM
ncbi:MAG TPA: hypothetical protein VLV49_02030 [Terriglobales bacterium]|nr:hypothetical protein [Terriglobales bacterium]